VRGRGDGVQRRGDGVWRRDDGVDAHHGVRRRGDGVAKAPLKKDAAKRTCDSRTTRFSSLAASVVSSSTTPATACLPPFNFRRRIFSA